MKNSKPLKEDVISQENEIEFDRELYLYGLQKMISMSIGIALTLVIAYLMDMLTQGILYIICYIVLRSYAGGYHAKSQRACYILSNILVVLALMGVNYIYQSPQICIAVLAISTIIIMKLAPIEAKNKPLDKMEVIVYRRKAITTLWILVLIALMLLFLDLHIYFASIVVAIMCVSIMLILGRYLIE